MSSEILRSVEEFKILKPIYIRVVERYGFYHADVPVDGLNAVGDTREDAIHGLQCLLGATYRVLSNTANLNTWAKNRLAWLREHLVEFSKDDEIKELRDALAAALQDAQELRDVLAKSREHLTRWHT